MTFFSVGIGNVLLELGVAWCPLKPLACKGGISDCDVDQPRPRHPKQLEKSTTF